MDEVLQRLYEVIARDVKVTIPADRGFADQELYALLKQLGFEYVVRFRQCITVTDLSEASAGQQPPACTGCSLATSSWRQAASITLKGVALHPSSQVLESPIMKASKCSPDKTHTEPVWHRIAAWGLVCVLFACSTTAPSPPVDDKQGLPQNIYEFILVVREAPGGQLEHAWTPATDWDWALNGLSESTSSIEGRIVLASRRPRDCDQEQIDCHRDCMRRKPPYPRVRKSFNHIQYCNEKCLSEYMDCLEMQKQQARRFPALRNAMEWLRAHRTEVLVGSVIVIAGIAFVTVSAGAGVIVLAPVVLLASATPQAGGPLQD